MARLAPSARPAAPRKRGSYAKSTETRERILAAAVEVAERRGFHGVALGEVARRAGVAVGLVSYHYGSREELLLAAMESVAHRVRESVAAASHSEGDVFARGESAMRTYLAFLREHPAYVRLGEEVRRHHPELYQRNLLAWLDLHRDSIRAGIEEGTLRPMSEEEIRSAAYMIVGAHYFLDQMMEGLGGYGYPGDDVVVATYMQLFRAGLQRPQPLAGKETPS